MILYATGDGSAVAYDRKDPGRYGNLRTRGGLLYYHYDALGSVSDLTDHLGENTVKYRWDAFGGMFAGTLAPYSFKGITGKDHDPKSGLMFYNSRWYDPQTGRFTQPDTFKGALHQPMTQHPYAYVGNNPINNLDPTGHDFLGYDTGGTEYGTDYYGDQSGSWNNFGEFVPGGSNDSGSGGWTPGGIVPGDIDSGGSEYTDGGGYYGGGGYGGGDGGGSGGGGEGESRPPTLEERNQVYSQASQPVPIKYNAQSSTLKQAVSYAGSMPAKPGVSKYRTSSEVMTREQLKQYPMVAFAEYDKNQHRYLTNLMLYGTTGQADWAQDQISETRFYSDANNPGGGYLTYQEALEIGFNKDTNDAIEAVPIWDDPVFILLQMVTGTGEIRIGIQGAKAGGRSVLEGAGKTVFKNIDEGLNFAATPAKHMENPGRFVPTQTLQDAIKSAKGVPDPRGSNAMMHYTTMTKNGQTYNLEVLMIKQLIPYTILSIQEKQ